MLTGPPNSLDASRRRLLRADRSGINGLDYVELEVEDPGDGVATADLTPAAARRLLKLYFVHPLSPEISAKLADGGTKCIRIDLGSHAAELPVTVVQINKDSPDQVLVTLLCTGGPHPYTLRLVEPGTDRPLNGIDPFLSAADFTFQTDCPVSTDVMNRQPSAKRPPPEPVANYLAKDYQTFRQLIYDRLALTLPQWKERHAPDLMVTLVELLAYVADYLSYYQDAVATEAYLGTARQRVSVRRHARLVDYPMHDGCNARAWVCLEVEEDVALKGKPKFVAGSETLNRVLRIDDVKAASGRHVIFEPLGDAPLELKKSRNRIALYSAAGAIRELPAGTTSAILLNPRGQLGLQSGDLLIFEWASPDAGSGEAPVRWAHAVRLVTVRSDPRTDSLTGEEILAVEWSAPDALPIAIPLISAGGVEPVVARGNVVLVDQGLTVEEPLTVPSGGNDNAVSGQGWTGATCRLQRTGVVFAPPFPDPAAVARFQSHLLLRGPVVSAGSAGSTGRKRPNATHASRHRQFYRSVLAATRRGKPLNSAVLDRLRYDLMGDDSKSNDPTLVSLPAALGSAASAMTFEPSDAVAAIGLKTVRASGERWEARRDLLNSRSEDHHFVAELDDEGVVGLRFGNGELGAVPAPGTTFNATYRIGGGAGNVGADQIGAIVPQYPDGEIAASSITRIWNPLPARGAASPEPLEDVRLYAPTGFRKHRERAVVAEDYAELAARVGGVAAASAEASYTGGFTRIRVAVLPRPGFKTAAMQQELIDEVGDILARYRRIGHRVSVVAARQVPLDVVLGIDLQPSRHRASVEADVLEVLGNRRLRSGRLGFFHPDNFSLGQTLSASDLLAIVQAVPGVRSVVLKRLRRMDRPAAPGEPPAMLKFGHDEVPRLDNDGRHPDRGQLALEPATQMGERR